MQQKFTQFQLVQYLYNETSASSTLSIEESLQEDQLLMEEFKELHTAYRQLPKVTFSPSRNAVQNILNYSACTAVENC